MGAVFSYCCGGRRRHSPSYEPYGAHTQDDGDLGLLVARGLARLFTRSSRGSGELAPTASLLPPHAASSDVHVDRFRNTPPPPPFESRVWPREATEDSPTHSRSKKSLQHQRCESEPAPNYTRNGAAGSRHRRTESDNQAVKGENIAEEDGSNACKSEKGMQRNFSAISLQDEDCCPTCLEGYTTENPRIETECGHHYHLGCIYEWMERSQQCPVCSKEMRFSESL
eukprot:jgi/Chlat1/1500/Chrsp12S02030